MKENSEWLGEMLHDLFRRGEIPWAANRKAIYDFDVLKEDEDGLKDLDIFFKGLDVLVSDLEGLRDASEKVSSVAAKVVRGL